MGTVHAIKNQNGIDKLHRKLKRKTKKLKQQAKSLKMTEKQQELDKIELISFDEVSNFRDMREKSLKMVLTLIPLAEALYREKPGQSSCYSLSNLINQAQELMGELEGSLDFEQMSIDLYNDVIVPFLEDILKDLGKSFKDTQVKLDIEVKSNKTRRLIDRSIKKLYRTHAISVEGKTEALKTKLEEFVSNYT